MEELNDGQHKGLKVELKYILSVASQQQPFVTPTTGLLLRTCIKISQIWSLDALNQIEH